MSLARQIKRRHARKQRAQREAHARRRVFLWLVAILTFASIVTIIVEYIRTRDSRRRP